MIVKDWKSKYEIFVEHRKRKEQAKETKRENNNADFK
jgi:hypothetical protein